MEYTTVLLSSYLSLLVISFLFNKRLSKSERIVHYLLYYIPLALFLFYYLTVFILLYLLNMFLTSRLFFRPMKLEDCPVGEENRISTLLSPLDILFQVSDKDFISADGISKLKGEFSIEKFKDSLLKDLAFATNCEGRLLYPKLTQVVRERTFFSTWEFHPNFNIDDHVIEKWLDLSVEAADVRQFLTEMNTKRIPPHQPGFQFFVLHDNRKSQPSEDTMTYVVYRLDHTLGDGVSFVRIFMNSLGKPLTEDDRTKLELLFDKFGKSPRVDSFKNLLLLALLSPVYLSDFLELEPANFFKRARSRGKKYLAFSPPLDFTKISSIKRVTNTSVNDVFLMLLGQAMQSYLLEKGERPDHAKFVSFMQAISLNVPLLHNHSISNNLLTIRVKIPTRTLDWREQLDEIHSANIGMKSSLIPFFNMMMLASTSYMPKWIRVPCQKFTIRLLMTGTLTNLPGPDVSMTLTGTPIDSMSVFVPLMAGLSFGCAFLTYDGHLSVSISVDGSVCTEPEAFIEHFIQRLDEIFQSVSQLNN